MLADAITAQQSALTQVQINTVCEILNRVVPGAEVRVFGSRATRTARPVSDLDSLVVKPSRLSWLQHADLRDLFEASDLPFLVDVVDADALPQGIADRVYRESIALG